MFPDFMIFFEVETLFVPLTTSFDRQFQDWSCPAKYTYYSSESFREKNDDYHLKVSIPKKTLLLAISRGFNVVY